MARNPGRFDLVANPRREKMAAVKGWKKLDIQDFEKCEVDAMLRELLVRCAGADSDGTSSLVLLENSLKSVLPFCNEKSSPKDIKHHLKAL